MDNASWQKCKQRVIEHVSGKTVNNFIHSLQYVENDDSLQILAPNQFILDWVNTEIGDALKQWINDHISSNTSVVFRIGSMTESVGRRDYTGKDDKSSNGITNRRVSAPQSGLLRNSINSKYTFETFVEGKSNNLAYEASKSFCNSHEIQFNPICLFGKTGVGKSHLMHAVGNHHSDSESVLCLSSDSFVSGIVGSFKNRTTEDLKNCCKSSTVFLLDDIHIIAGKERTQEIFLQMLDDLIVKNRQIIVTSTIYPSKIDGLHDHIKSRLDGGLIAEIDEPEHNTRVRILEAKAKQRGVQLPHDVAIYIASNIKSNVRTLEGALNNLFVYAANRKESISIAMAKEVLETLISSHERLITIDSIKKIVADYFHVKITDLSSKSRARAIVRPRYIAMSLCRDLTSSTFAEIASAFGKRNYSSIIYACRKTKELCVVNKTFNKDVKSLEQAIMH